MLVASKRTVAPALAREMQKFLTMAAAQAKRLELEGRGFESQFRQRVFSQNIC